MNANRSQQTVWAMVFLDRSAEESLRKFFLNVCGVNQQLITRNMHCTIYHARRPIAGISDTEEHISISVTGSELRMMTMTPGGENPRPDINPSDCSIGIRIRRASGVTAPFETLRDRFLALETSAVLGTRLPSNHRRSAFGARHFQPHVKVLQAGAVSDPDLSRIGSLLRTNIPEVRFDRLVVKNRSN